MSSLVRVFHASALEDRAMFLYQQQDRRRMVFTDMIKYVASAAFALVAREKKRQETLKDIAVSARLPLRSRPRLARPPPRRHVQVRQTCSSLLSRD